MARKNEGSVYPDTSRPGKWRACITHNGKKSFKRFDSEEEANNWVIEQRAAINKGTYIEPKETTVGMWLVDWLEVYVKPKVKARSYERYLVTLPHLEPLYKYKIQALNPHHVQKFYTTSQLTQNAKNKAHKLLKAALKQAMHNQLISRNPLDVITAPAAPKKETQIMEVKDINKILMFCKQHKRYGKYFPIFFTLANTGARIGEVLALEWSSVNLENRTIYIRQAVEYTKTHGTRIVEPKTAAGKRIIAISDEAVRVLQPLQKKEGFVFQHKRGGYYDANNIGKVWRALFKNYNEQKDSKGKLILKTDELIPYCHLHTLRHTFATMMIAQSEVSISDLSAFLGHAKISHTLDLYGHAIPKNRQVIADSISNIYQLN